ncbi:MAG TPA: WXG100 family type VII secretion target [Anaerovoracaceae bacterium]|nr:WXG100 family type VII secretion target [Anaerovoracaceae bacterium]
MAIMNFNYNQAINQAKQLEGVANEMLNVANKQFQTTVDSIQDSWEGKASQQFLSYCIATQEDIKKQARKLQDLAGRIREVARIIEEAEQRAKESQRRKEAKAAVKH